MIHNALNGCLLRYLHPAYCHPARIRKVDRSFEKEIDFVVLKFPVKIKGINKVEKKNSTSISVFSYNNEEKYKVDVSKKCFEENILICYQLQKKIKDATFLLYYQISKNYCKLSANSLAMITQFLQMSINKIMMLLCQNMLLR